MFNQKYIILFIDRNRFYLCSGVVSNIALLDVPESILHDLEIIQKDGFYTLIKQWVKEYALIGSQLIIILSTRTYFEKLLLTAEHDQIESDILRFFDTVPYESIWTKVYPVDKGKRAVVLNKSLYEALYQGFALQGVTEKAILPEFVLGPLAGKQTLTSEAAEYVFKNIDLLAKQSLLDIQESITASQPPRDETAVPKKKSNLQALLGVFGVLILILAILLLTRH
ncbi:MAG TPA: hypothetical protein VMR81_02910 [Patescibacteria group bacterium]|jgi:hypothetical protein|nr:hypothetical protein [Patescibacteria group bacterium]